MARHPAEQPPRAYSRLGLVVAIVLVLAGLGSLALGLLPGTWRQQAATYAGDAWQSLQALGDRLLPLTIGAVSLLLGLIALVVVVRRGRKRARQRGTVSDILAEPTRPLSTAARLNDMAPTSVYLDLENNTLAASQVTLFVQFLRESIKTRTGTEWADQFFYCDASNFAKRSTYQAFQEYGFQAIDVPHRRFDEAAAQRDEAQPDGVNLKNFVDVEMALHAHYRALLAPAPQLIIIISEDVDFIPLVRRLRRLGHQVQLWSREIKHDFKRLESTLGVETVSFGSHIPAGSSGAKSQPPAIPRLETATVPVSAGASPIQQAISVTFRCIRSTEAALRSNPGSPQQAEAALRSRLSGWPSPDPSKSLFARLGYDDSGAKKRPNRVQFWLDELKALGVLVDSGGPLPAAGATDPAHGATLLYGFLQQDVAVALASWKQSGRAGDPYNAVCEYVVSRESDSEPQPIRNLRHLLSKDEFSHHVRHAQYLCQCARSLGLTEIDPRDTAAGETTNATPAASPPSDESQT